MHSQLTEQDFEDYGTALIDMTQRAAREVMAPELQRLHADNQNLRVMAARSQRADIERALDAQVPGWHEVYQTPAFSQWLSEFDPYNGVPRTQLLRQAVAAGDAHRVVRFYQGFLGEVGRTPAGQSRGGSNPRRTTPSGTIYTRPQIRSLYELRARNAISDAKWGPLEADIIKAGAEGRVVGAVGPDGTELSRWAR
jgi:hypothetical protein